MLDMQNNMQNNTSQVYCEYCAYYNMQNMQIQVLQITGNSMHFNMLDMQNYMQNNNWPCIILYIMHILHILHIACSAYYKMQNMQNMTLYEACIFFSACFLHIFCIFLAYEIVPKSIVRLRLKQSVSVHWEHNKYAKHAKNVSGLYSWSEQVKCLFAII